MEFNLIVNDWRIRAPWSVLIAGVLLLLALRGLLGIADDAVMWMHM